MHRTVYVARIVDDVCFMTMNFSDPLGVASIGGLITLTGYFISNTLERSRTIRIREMEFRDQ